MELNWFCFFVVAVLFVLDKTTVVCGKKENSHFFHIKKVKVNVRDDQVNADVTDVHNNKDGGSSDHLAHPYSGNVRSKVDIDHPHAYLSLLRLQSNAKVGSTSRKMGTDFRKFKWKQKKHPNKASQNAEVGLASGRNERRDNDFRKFKWKKDFRKSKSKKQKNRFSKDTKVPDAARELENANELTKTKSLLRQTMVANKLLKKQNRRLKQVWKALGQMCKVLNADTEEQEKHEKVEQPDPLNGDTFNIYPVEVTCSPFDENNNTFAVYYKAPVDSTEIWEKSSGGYEGRDYSVGTRYYNSKTDTFVSSLHDAEDKLQQLRVRHKDIEMVVALFIGSELNRSAVLSQKLSDPHISIEKPMSDIVAPLNENLTTFFIVNGNTSAYNFQARATFQGLNHTASFHSPTYFSVNAYSSRMRIRWTNISHSQWNVSVEIDNMYSRFGGILTVGISIRPAVYKLQQSLVYDTVFYKDYEILSNISSPLSAVPPGRWALKPIADMTWLMKPNQTISCLAMGNPRPDEVVMSKVTERGYSDVKTLLHVIQSNFITEKIYWLSLNDPDAEGKYVCRVPNLGQTGLNLETTTEVTIYEKAQITTHVSGEGENTGGGDNKQNMVDVFCVTSGKPRPKLQITLYETYGPDLTMTKYMMFRTYQYNATTELAAVRIPSDIHTVYCNALQLGRTVDNLKIELLEPGHWNWTFYEDVRQEAEQNREHLDY